MSRRAFERAPAGEWSDGARRHYRNSMVYRQTVVTADGNSQRAALQCWYAMLTARVTGVTQTDAGQMRLTVEWNLSDALWETVRIPVQWATFGDHGRLLHAAVDRESSTSVGVLVWNASNCDLRPGDSVPLMLRRKPPAEAYLGPIEVDTDRRIVFIQIATEQALPEARTHLLYLGARSPYPQRPCRLEEDASTAAANIFAVEAVEWVADRDRALQSEIVATTAIAWYAVTPWVDVAVLQWATPLFFAGMEYEWPYRVGDNGSAYVLLPVNVNGGAPLPRPAAVWFVKEVTSPRDTGDRYPVFGANGLPTHVAEEGSATIYPLPPSSNQSPVDQTVSCGGCTIGG